MALFACACFILFISGTGSASTTITSATTMSTTSATTSTNSSSNSSTTTSSGENVTPTYESMKTLQADILSGYETTIRPRKNLSDAVEMNVTFTLTSVTDFDVAKQRLSFTGYFLIFWVDQILVWNPSLYKNIQQVQIPVKKIWTPNLIYSTAYEGRGEILKTGVALIYPSGYAIWSAEGTYDITCEVNIKFYPFDKQTCHMGLYIDDTVRSLVDIKSLGKTGSLEMFTKNSAWKLNSYYFEKKVFMEVSVIVTSFELERRPEFAIYTIIAPLTLLSAINIGVFIVPAESGEKGSIAVTIFLSYGVFLSIISSELPHNSVNVSYLFIYILLLLVLSVLAVLYSFIQAWVYSYHGDKVVSFNIFRKLFRLSDVNSLTGSDDGRHEMDKSNADLKLPTALLTTTENSRQTPEKTLTWRDFLRRMDAIVFSVLFLSVLIFTSVWFAYLANN